MIMYKQSQVDTETTLTDQLVTIIEKQQYRNDKK